MKTFALSSVLATLIGLGSFATPAAADNDWRDRRRDARRFERELRERGYETRVQEFRGDYVVHYRFAW